MDMPQFQRLNMPIAPQGVQATFNGTMTQAILPKILAYSQVSQGNVMLYESNKTTLLLVLPPGLSITIPNVKLSERPLPIVGGEKNGFAFYKNRPDQLSELDKIIGTVWRDQLSEPLPIPPVTKTPELLCRNNILYNGHQFSASLWEYSEKSLAIFAPMDFSGGNEKLMKPFSPLICPDLPVQPNGKPGACSGFMIYKNTRDMINFAKQFFPIPFESMYKKSVPPIAQTIPVTKQYEPTLIETKSFMFNGQQIFMEFIELSPFAIALFPTPMIPLDGFDMKELYHPTGNKRPGYLVAKSQKDKINLIQTFFGLSNLEDMYTLFEEVSARADINQQTTTQKSFSDLSINSFDDIPISTLLRLIQNKLKTSNDVTSKNEISGQILIYGDEDKVNLTAANLDEMETSIQVKVGTKMAVFLIPTLI